MHQLAHTLWDIPRSITGNGVRKTLDILQDLIPDLTTFEVPTGTQCFDWQIPREWNINDAYIIDPEGKKIVDFKKSNLHVVSYSTAVNTELSLDELQQHLYSLPRQSDAIPYLTYYYKDDWCFCITHKQRLNLKEGNYKVVIDSEFSPGSLSYGELLLPGRSEKEIFLSCYICHPSLGHNELSGPIVTTYIAKWLSTLNDRKYSYRIIFVPETIGAIAYLSRHYRPMKQNTIAGFLITCIGNNEKHSYMPSRLGNTLADKVALHVLKHLHPDFTAYSFLQRGSDERQYCSPGIDLPVACLMHAKYGEYPEYHTSLDNLDYITAAGLYDGFEMMQKCIDCLEQNETLVASLLCEPQLGKRGLYEQRKGKDADQKIRSTLDLLAYCDGRHSLLEIADLLCRPLWELTPLVQSLKQANLIELDGVAQ